MRVGNQLLIGHMAAHSHVWVWVWVYVRVCVCVCVCVCACVRAPRCTAVLGVQPWHFLVDQSERSITATHHLPTYCPADSACPLQRCSGGCGTQCSDGETCCSGTCTVSNKARAALMLRAGTLSCLAAR